MPTATCSKEFKAQVVREVIEKDRTVYSVASSVRMTLIHRR